MRLRSSLLPAIAFSFLAFGFPAAGSCEAQEPRALPLAVATVDDEPTESPDPPTPVPTAEPSATFTAIPTVTHTPVPTPTDVPEPPCFEGFSPALAGGRGVRALGQCNPCGNGSCDRELGEDFLNCPIDCAPPPGIRCGNGSCEPGEDSVNCITDCPLGLCGNQQRDPAGNPVGICHENESCSNCPADCGPCNFCGDGWCTGLESACGGRGFLGDPAAPSTPACPNPLSLLSTMLRPDGGTGFSSCCCPQDCPVPGRRRCGDLRCTRPETSFNCPVDCQSVACARPNQRNCCGNNRCESWENSHCPQDCRPIYFPGNPCRGRRCRRR